MPTSITLNQSGSYIGRLPADYLSLFVAYVTSEVEDPSTLTITYFDGSQTTLSITSSCPENPPGPPGITFGAAAPPSPAPTVPNVPTNVVATAGTR